MSNLTEEEKATVKAAAMREVIAGLRDGTIRIRYVRTCSWCRSGFDSDADFENHRIDGKTTDPATGQKRRICPK